MKKNIILITADEMRFDSLGCMGNKVVKTPNLDLLAKEGQLYTNSYCVSPLCVPSRVCMFTGQYVCRNQSTFFAESDHVNSSRGSDFIESLKSNGYKIGISGKNHAFTDEYFDKWFDYREQYGHWGKQYGTFTEGDRRVCEWRQNEKRPYFVEKNKGLPLVLQEGFIEEAEPFNESICMTSRIADDALTFINQNKENRFFLYFSFPDPHWPVTVCEPYYSLYDPKKIETPYGLDMDWDNQPVSHFLQNKINGFEKLSENEIKKMIAVYYGMITYMDKAIGKVIDSLKELDLYDNTLILFTADHGNFAGQYGLLGKGKWFCDPLIRIPLIIRDPDVERGKIKNANISNIDFLPTLFDCAKIKVPHTSQGVSFYKLLKGESNTHRQVIFSEVGRPVYPSVLPSKTEFQLNEEQSKVTESIRCRWFLEYLCNGRAVMIKEENYKYVYYVGEKSELYNLETDPYEIDNLTDNPEFAVIKSQLQCKLFDWLLTQPFQPCEKAFFEV